MYVRFLLLFPMYIFADSPALYPFAICPVCSVFLLPTLANLNLDAVSFPPDRTAWY